MTTPDDAQDPTPTRAFDVEVEVPGTPEQVWQAIATGPGIGSWFVPHTIDERVGGQVVMDFGPSAGEITGTVEVWDPPRRVAFRGDGGGGPLGYEWTVEARSGDRCVVRLVNSGFGPGEEWDSMFEAMQGGWKIFMENLRLHLTHFAGRAARAIIPNRMIVDSVDGAFDRLCAALDIPSTLEPGSPVRSAVSGLPVVEGTVVGVNRTDQVATYHLLLDAPAPGTAFVAAEGGVGGPGTVVVSLYLYLYGAEDAAPDDEWTPYLTAVFPDQ